MYSMLHDPLSTKMIILLYAIVCKSEIGISCNGKVRQNNTVINIDDDDKYKIVCRIYYYYMYYIFSLIYLDASTCSTLQFNFTCTFAMYVNC